MKYTLEELVASFEARKTFVLGYAPSGDWCVFNIADPTQSSYGATIQECLHNLHTLET